MEKHICCICGKEFEGYGNNPDPVRKEGRCCDICNNLVILERLRLMQIANTVTRKIEVEIKDANSTKGTNGVNEVLKKYDLDDLMIKEA